MIYLYIILLIIVIIMMGMYFLSLLNNIIYGVPQVSTFNSDLKLLKKVFDKYIVSNKKIVDLGSGTGKMIRLFEREYKMKSTGFEIDFSNVVIARILNKILGLNTKTYKKNYLKTDLSNFDFIYLYLFPVLMKKLEEKIWSNCKPGTIIFVNAFKFEKHEPIEVFYKNGKEKIFVYEV